MEKFRGLSNERLIREFVHDQMKAMGKALAVQSRHAAELKRSKKWATAVKAAEEKIAAQTEKIKGLQSEKIAFRAQAQAAAAERDILGRRVDALNEEKAGFVLEIANEQLAKETALKKLKILEARKPEEEEEVVRVVVERFKASMDFQAALAPTYSQGYRAALRQVLQHCPGVNLSGLMIPGHGPYATEDDLNDPGEEGEASQLPAEEETPALEDGEVSQSLVAADPPALETGLSGLVAGDSAAPDVQAGGAPAQGSEHSALPVVEDLPPATE